jgi:hypothetical protein
MVEITITDFQHWSSLDVVIFPTNHNLSFQQIVIKIVQFYMVRDLFFF